jgi:serine/threonine-protein kinase RsbW
MTKRKHQCVTEIEILIPSELGYEKVAMASVATIAKKMGFPPDKIEDLKTALAEACTNAIEHGNSLDIRTQVSVVVRVKADRLKIKVIDEGHRPIPTQIPERDFRPDFRGLGLSLIQMLMDKVEINCQPGRNEIEMTSFVPSPSLAM